MTVTYSLEASTSGLATFLRLLFRWKGSIYKLMWKEVVIFLGLYFGIGMVYRFGLVEPYKTNFENFAIFCNRHTSYIPLTFLLGFYVTMIVGRWWKIFMSIPWPDNILILLSAYMSGSDEESRIFRRTFARLLNLANLLVLRDISSAVRKRFPTMDHLVIAGIMTEEEQKIYEELDWTHHKGWMPIQWCVTMLQDAASAGKIHSERYVLRLQDELLNYKAAIGMIFCYDWISVPLSYTQVVTLAVHSFFLACLFGRQFLEPNELNIDFGKGIDVYFPLFTFLQFMFYMGWLKVAETLINPLGEDDDDFEINYIIDRNLQVSYVIVDKNNQARPSLVRDPHWEETVAEVPHTAASRGLKMKPFVASAATIEVPEVKAEPFLVSNAEILGEPSVSKKRHSDSIYIRNRLQQNELDKMPKFLLPESPENSGQHSPPRCTSAPQLGLVIEDDHSLTRGEQSPKFGRLIKEKQRKMSAAGVSRKISVASNTSVATTRTSSRSIQARILELVQEDSANEDLISKELA